MSKLPIFAAPATGGAPQQLLHRARMFRNAAMELADYVSYEQNWPKFALLTHAIELALKAFVDHAEQNGPTHGPRVKNHDLVGWYQRALQCGLQDDPIVAQHISVLSELHETHYARYPQHRNTPVPALHNIVDATVDQLLDVFTRIVNHR